MSWFDPHFNSLFEFMNEHCPELLAEWLATCDPAARVEIEVKE